MNRSCATRAMRLMLATLMIVGASTALAQAAAPSAGNARSGTTAHVTRGAPLVINNRTVFVFRGTAFGATPEDRAEASESRLEAALARGGPGTVTSRETSEGTIVLVDGQGVFLIVPGDVGIGDREGVAPAAEQAVAALGEAIAVGREGRDLRVILLGTGLSALAALLYAGIVRMLWKARLRIGQRLLRRVDEQAGRLNDSGFQAFGVQHAMLLTRRAVDIVAALLIVFATYVFLAFVLERFPYSRPWGNALGSNLVELAVKIGLAILDAVPGLVTVLVIFVLARGAVRLAGAFFDRIARGEAAVGTLDRDTVVPTRRIVSMIIWLFALAMAYPYLPGANTEAFRGLSVIIGLMVSLGGANVVGRALAGLTIMYTRVLKRGEFVRIGDIEGTVTDVGFLVTRISTGTGEEVILPNSEVASTATRNFSRAADGGGFVVHTGVTIGYATPWRQVHALLLEAARRTPGLAAHPAPYVLQTALSDFYVEYRLVANGEPSSPAGRAEAMSALHASVLDVFNEYGVQIMSPHYIADPPDVQVVPKAHWFDPPAAPDQPSGTARRET